jgi:hypothetical protein
VIEHLLAARLCTATEGPGGEDRIEIVHETLLTAWPRLAAWRDEDRDGARLRDQLRAAARQWDERGRPRGLLWRDDALGELRRWRARHAVPLTAAEEAFADASLRDAARARRRRTLLVAAAFAVLGGGAAGLFVAGRAARARATELILERGRDLLLQGEARRALPLLADAYRRGADGAPVHYLIARAADTVEAEQAVLHHDDRVNTIHFNPAGDRVATCSDDHTAVVWDARTGERVFTLRHPSIAGVCRFSPDGTQLATSCYDGAARVWDARDGHLIHTRRGGQEGRILPRRDALLQHGQRFVAAVDSSGRGGDRAGARSYGRLRGQPRREPGGHGRRTDDPHVERGRRLARRHRAGARGRRRRGAVLPRWDAARHRQ